MVSVEQWKKHFRNMSNKGEPSENLYVVKTARRGLGRGAFDRTTYQIRQPREGPNPAVQIVSPVAQDVERAKTLMDKKTIKRARKRKYNKQKSSGRGGKRRKKTPAKKKRKRRRKKKTIKKKRRKRKKRVKNKRKGGKKRITRRKKNS